MIEAFGYGFFQTAILTGIAASVICGIIGSYVVVKHMVAIAGGLSHSAFGGIGLGYLAGVEPLAGASGFTILVAVLIWGLADRARQHIDTLVGAFWAGGMAFGILCISLTPGYTPDLFSYLFGNILLVPPMYLLLTVVLAVFITGITIALYPALQAVAFDAEYASLLGVPLKGIQLVYLILIAISIVLLIQVVGIILVIAMLTLPAAITREFSTTLKGMMAGSAVTGCILTTAGIMLSWIWDIPSGSTIILLSVIVYLLTISGRDILRRNRSAADG